MYQAVTPLKGGSQDKARQGSWRHYSRLPFSALSFSRRVYKEGASQIPRTVPFFALYEPQGLRM